MDTRIMNRHGGTMLLAVALLLPTVATGQQHFPADEDLEVMVHYLVEDGATPGIVFGVLESDGSARIVSNGSGGPGTRPLGPGSVFEIGSITKTFTGTLLADMVARGEVALEDPVSKYLPDSVRVPARNGREMTLLDLATHRSGLPGVPDDFLPGDLSDPYADFTIERLYGFLSRHELGRDPGAEVEYSNMGFGLLGHALARAAGMPYRDLLRERVLEPLGMDMTGYRVEGEASEWLARGHKHGRGVGYWSTTEAIDGAGGLYSTAADLLKYLEANVGPAATDLERAMREAQRGRKPFDEAEEIGLGWRIQHHGDGRIIQHGGTSGGFTARIAFDPARRVGFVRLTNTRDFPGDLGLDLLRDGPPLDIADAEVPTEVLERYVGTYELAPGVHFFVRLEPDGTLTTQPGRKAIRLRQYAESDSSFFLKRLPRRAAFRTKASGAVDAMVIDPETRPRTLPKVSDDTPPPGLPARLEVLDLPLDPGEMARYVGEYNLDADGQTLEARIYREGGALMAQIVGGPVSRLLHQGDHAFLLDADTDHRMVFDVAGDSARGLTLSQGGRTLAVGRRPGAPAPPPAAAEPDILDLPTTAEDITRYEGTYLLEIGSRTLELRIFGQDGRLMSQAAGQRVAPLRYQGDHVFVPDFSDAVRLVFTVEDGRATRVTLHQGGGAFPGDRKPSRP